VAVAVAAARMDTAGHRTGTHSKSNQSLFVSIGSHTHPVESV
jgi:hypothetical protein